MATKFIKKSIIFFIIFFLILNFLNFAYVKLVLAKTSLYRKENQFYKYKDSIHILFLGDSHVEKGINPNLIPNSFNFASAGENYVQTYYKFEKILSLCPNIEVVVLPIDLHSFSSFRSTRFNNEWYWDKYINFKELSNNIEDLSVLEKKIRAMYPVIGKGKEIISIIIHKPKLSKLVKGQKIAPSNNKNNFFLKKNKDDIAKKRANYHFKGSNPNDDLLYLYFEKMLKLASTHNIKVILIKFPITKEYYQRAITHVNKEDLYKKIDNIISQYNNINILDYQKIYFDKEWFFEDSDHLNIEGANNLTNLIKKEL